MIVNKIEQYLRSHLQRFYNTFGANDAKPPFWAIFYASLSHAETGEDGGKEEIGGNGAGDGAQVGDGLAQGLGDEVGGEGGAEAVEDAADAGEG